jgi:hypothetical protein
MERILADLALGQVAIAADHAARIGIMWRWSAGDDVHAPALQHRQRLCGHQSMEGIAAARLEVVTADLDGVGHRCACCPSNEKAGFRWKSGLSRLARDGGTVPEKTRLKPRRP